MVKEKAKVKEDKSKVIVKAKAKRKIDSTESLSAAKKAKVDKSVKRKRGHEFVKVKNLVNCLVSVGRIVPQKLSHLKVQLQQSLWKWILIIYVLYLPPNVSVWTLISSTV